MADDTILETRGLTKEFKGFVAVKDVQPAIRRGTIHALIGPNGAGKTTCFNLLTHFLTPTRGQIFYNGREITGSRPAAIARMGLVRSFQISAVFPQPHRARERAHRAAAQARPLVRLLALGEQRCARSTTRALRADRGGGPHGVRAHARAASLPYGRKRALEIATTLALDPEMMLLDEPTAGMTHEDVERIAALIRKVAVEPHGADGRAQPVGRLHAVRPHHRARARRDARRRRLRDRVEASRTSCRPILGPRDA